ncbi:TonB-dependent Receptor Plug Domain [Arsukibacterium tuosuense]|uniref:TonB-dependent Receptor Plug Domain n=1 Tax=Arsukibacterium tuosuense TaxID=1323745 RepID=A0A285IWI5_9GAMM|nr:TonB-dependent receptor [Arsukibacterium tuosuense]SNY52410.1 TonB-dependent Receptor Plug Domain [Arsukibacterium tuosuense]
MTVTTKKKCLSVLISAVLCAPGLSFADTTTEAEIESITIVGKKATYANNIVDESMKNQQSNMTSVLAVIDNLPGVLINEGDAFGADDWSTSISIRGFQVDLSQQQIGITIDGIANGNSNYGGGAKANRYIDSENLALVEVSQGTADIASRSNEALGGTLNFTTIDPDYDKKITTSLSLGESDAQKFFVRLNSGEIFDNTFAWLSVSTQNSSDWMDQAAENTRDHFAAKVISMIGDTKITGYLSYDDTHEDNYQRIYGLAQFAQEPTWDQLTSEWTGIPYIDQAYRRGWSTLRENLFGYLEAEWQMGSVDFKTNVYYHDNEGRGDWIPPYLVEVTNDGAGNANSELLPQTVFGGPFLGQIFFVNQAGATLTPNAGCVSSLTFPYGGGAAQYDPACYQAGAIPVSSYRHTHYKKQRLGINGDFTWETQIAEFDNVLRGGFWYEDVDRGEYRDWHKIIDSRTGFRYDNTPYWVQYDREFPTDTLMYYVQNEIDFGAALVKLGLKQFNVDVAKDDLFNSANDIDVSSDSDLLLNIGIVVPVNKNLEIFSGFAQNFAAVKDVVLERDDADVSFVEPEETDNFDLGLRYSGNGINAGVTYYQIKFDNRITFISSETVTGIDFLESAAGGYINDGGVESSGFEASVDYALNANWRVYSSLTINDSEYTDAAIKGNKVLGVAENMAVLTLDWQQDDYFAGVSTKYVGKRPLDQENSAEVDSYTVTDFYIGTASKIAETDVQLRLTINNLFDTSYLGTIAPGAGWIGAPRTASFNVTATF